ncbi:hypothetical protein N658DRAFT_15552 [Parathielavia hyrcaniae]|uniref:Uncharacterized protein n=1 Tax=Parathielavia hyrcaniae TaxID=113614 RepID=A0AAN6QCM9_9PEZI|nr:hypothetical protein N658DRAFT_15552 [Parathielavia hyrcaniae]
MLSYATTFIRIRYQQSTPISEPFLRHQGHATYQQVADAMIPISRLTLQPRYALKLPPTISPQPSFKPLVHGQQRHVHNPNKPSRPALISQKRAAPHRAHHPPACCIACMQTPPVVPRRHHQPATGGRPAADQRPTLAPTPAGCIAFAKHTPSHPVRRHDSSQGRVGGLTSGFSDQTLPNRARKPGGSPSPRPGE